ncbi:MAG: hypothetical protein ABIR24_12440, partial [Verrucomicrobiota bacterium]
HAAVIRGYPAELAWSEAGTEPNFCVQFGTTNRLWSVPAASKSEAISTMHDLINSFPVLPKQSEILIELPMSLNRHWGDENEREDNWYRWNVEAVDKKRFKIKGVSIASPIDVFTLGYRTAPDHVLLKTAPSIGVLEYFYNHHGTVAEVNVRLVEIEWPKKP